MNDICFPSLQIDSGNLIYIPELHTANPEYWMSKLAFHPYRSQECKTEILINRRDFFSFDKSKYQLSIPSYTSEQILSYLLRTVVDYFQVSIGNLPLHAAAVTVNNCQVVILANSGSGKSYISQLLSQSNPNCYVIGDDHIIIHETYIQGNKMMRARLMGTNEPIYIANQAWGRRHRTIIVCYEKNEIRHSCTPFQNSWDLLAKMQNLSAFKYLMNDILLNGKVSPSNNLWKEDMLKPYELLAYATASSAEAFSIIGSHRYAVEQIHKLVDTQ